ncbi:MAG: protein phosphatase 2C domain-containing protein [Clostridiaceae bacterium]|nr:protein phosphatase 2C domain-containing protein [Clostridiaceae bacterium]
MLLDGISVRGVYHEVNQDSFAVQKLEQGFVAVVSDGLGSKKHSQEGSKAVCESTVETAERLGSELRVISPDEFIRQVHALWKKKLSACDLSECYATMLAFVLYDGRAFAVRLGDGFIAVWADEEVCVLVDDKEEYFVNETDCFTESLQTEHLEARELDISDFYGGVICSDGVPIGMMQRSELADFTKEFTDGYGAMAQEEVSADICLWLREWVGSDDKTLVYFLAERER